MATTTARRAAPVVRPIRTGQEFDDAVAELDELANANPREGRAAYDRMGLLAILIAAYEDDNLPPFESASPQEVVRFMAEQRGIDCAALAELLGGRSRLSEFLSGTRALSRNQIMTLRDAWGIPADLLLGA